MCETELDLLRVTVPVGFLLSEPREITVSVDRPEDPPLAIRLRLIPADSSNSRHGVSSRPHQTRRLLAWDADEGYPHPEYGGGD